MYFSFRKTVFGYLADLLCYKTSETKPPEKASLYYRYFVKNVCVFLGKFSHKSLYHVNIKGRTLSYVENAFKVNELVCI